MADPAPSYRNLDRFFIRLKKGESMALSAALQRHLQATPEQVERLLAQGSVWDGERKVRLKDGNMVIRGELLRVDRPKFPIPEFVLDAADIKYQDSDLLVVFKHGGVPVQPTPYGDRHCLLHGVQRYLSASGGSYRAAPINRLDLPAQGLVFFAKNKQAEAALHRLFKERRVRKRYLAATAAFPGVQPSYVIRSRLEWQGRSRDALTYARFCREKDGRYYFLVFPQSGRTHQIRRHFQERVAPLAGDIRYGGAASGAELGLLCFEYVFPHPATRKRISVRYIPAAWREAMGIDRENLAPRR